MCMPLPAELFGANENEMRTCKDPTTKMRKWFGEMERTQPLAAIVGFKWKPYVMGVGTHYGSAWDWVSEHNVSVVWMTRNLLDVHISNAKHEDDALQAHCKPGDDTCIAQHRDVKVTLDHKNLVSKLKYYKERYETNLTASMQAKGVRFMRVMFEHLFVGDEDFSETKFGHHTRLFLRPRLDSHSASAIPWRVDPLAAWNRIFSFVGVEAVEDYSAIQRVATLEYERTDARTNCDSIKNLNHVRRALRGTRFEGLLGC